MKKKILLAGAAMLFAAVAVTGFTAFRKTSVPDLLNANVEALAQGELPYGGTCCPDTNSVCPLEFVTIAGAYYKSDGPC